MESIKKKTILLSQKQFIASLFSLPRVSQSVDFLRFDIDRARSAKIFIETPPFFGL